MTIKILMSLIIGIAIGMEIRDSITNKLNKSKEDLIKSYEALVSEQHRNIKFYGEYVNFLESEYIDGYKKALDDTFKKNIDLKKKLKAYK